MRVSHLEKGSSLARSSLPPPSMAAQITGVYLHVVADVISNVRADFLNEGIDEAVLQELQSLWELNMMQAGAIQATAADLSYARAGGGGHPPITPLHDLNIPYEGETPTAELLFPPTPVHTPLPTFNAPGPNASANEHSEIGIIGDIAIGRPATFMSPTWMNPQLGTSLGMTPRLDMNIAYDGAEEEETSSGQYPETKEFLPPSIGKRKRDDMGTSYLPGNYFPQHDGAGDVCTRPFALSQMPCGLDAGNSLHMKDSRALVTKKVVRKGLHQNEQSEDRILTKPSMNVIGDSHSAATLSIPQFDGIGDNYDDGVAEEDYNEFGEGEQMLSEDGDLKQSKAEEVESDGSEPPLNEDDDLDGPDYVGKGDQQSKMDNIVLAQFEKVTRTKNKWKCILKDGIMHLNNRDYLFSRANGEFEF